MNLTLYAILYSSVITGFFAIALLVGLRQKSAVYRYFSVFAFLLGSWQLLQFIAQLLINTHSLAVWLLKISVAVVIFAAADFLFFATAYTEGSIKRLAYVLAACISGGLVLFSPSLQEAQISRAGTAVSSIDALYGLGILYTTVCFAYGIFKIFLHLVRNHNQRRRRQDLILLISVLQGFAVVFLVSIFSHENSYLQFLVPFSCLITAIIIAYAMVYSGLFDIHFFVVRAVAYLTSLFVLTLVFVTPIVLVLSHFLGIHYNVARLAVSIFFGGCLLSLVQYLRQKFDRVTSKIFFRHYYDPQDVLDKLGNVLVRTADMGTLRNQTAQILQEALKPSDLRYMLLAERAKQEAELARRLDAYSAASGSKLVNADEMDDEGHGLRAALKSQNIALAVKLRTTHEDLGFMVLGYKRSGEAYIDRDKRLLSVAADEIAISLQNALRFQEIQQFNVTLQQKVDEATRKLRQTNQKLVELDETKDDFISMASHQLRTPLTSVKGYLSMVLEGDAGKLNAQQAKMLRQAFTSSQRMVYLITDLLNISRLRTGKFVIDPAPSDLGQVAQQEVGQLVETAAAKDIQLTYQKPAAFPRLMLDETKTRQVIMNFIDNAIYYTPAGGHIRVELEEKPATVELRVVDDGIGVPKSEQHHLFTKFYRAANARKTRPDGTGLGLFMAKKVITAQGGSTIFSSREGHGSTFGFVFSKTRLKIPDSSAQTTSHASTK